jgi:hypothetical protein
LIYHLLPLSFCLVKGCLPLIDHALFLHLNRWKRLQFNLEAEVGDFRCLVSVQSKRNRIAELQDNWDISNTIPASKRWSLELHIFLYLFIPGPSHSCECNHRKYLM